MKSYLSLVPISAKVRRRQNRMTILCIICAVFLVTAIFSVTDMMIRTESSIMLSKHGNWHLQLDHISQDIAEEICRRTEYKNMLWEDIHHLSQIMELFSPKFSGAGKKVLWWKKEKKKLSYMVPKKPI